MKFDTSKYIEITKENLFKRVSNIELLQYYIPGKGIKYSKLCDFHKESTPSMCVDLSKGIWKCFGCGKSGDALNYIQEKYNLTFFESLKVAFADFGLTTHNHTKVPLEVLGLPLNQIKSLPTDIRIKSRDWTKSDIDYWLQFGISNKTCLRFNVFPISHYWVNDYMFTIKKGELLPPIIRNKHPGDAIRSVSATVVRPARGEGTKVVVDLHYTNADGSISTISNKTIHKDLIVSEDISPSSIPEVTTPVKTSIFIEDSSLIEEDILNDKVDKKKIKIISLIYKE